MRLITCALLLCAVVTVYIPKCDSCTSSKVIHRTYEVESGSSEHSYEEVRSGGGPDVRITVNRHVTIEGDGGGLGLIHDLERKGVLSLSHSLKLGGSSQRSKHVHSSITSKSGHSSRSKHVHSSSRNKHAHSSHHTSSGNKHVHSSHHSSSSGRHVHSSSHSSSSKHVHSSHHSSSRSECKHGRCGRIRKRVESVMCPGVVSYTTDHFRRVILDTHNEFRSALALGNVFYPKKGTTLRRANSMLRLNYGCALDHRVLTDVSCQHPPRKIAFGRHCETDVNVYWSKSLDPITAVKEAMNFWWNDLQRRQYLEQIQNLYYSHLGLCNMAPMGSDLTTDVACGTDDCGDKTLVVCRYSFSKKLLNGMIWYHMGPPCRQCQRKWGTSTCQDGLCVRD